MDIQYFNTKNILPNVDSFERNFSLIKLIVLMLNYSNIIIVILIIVIIVNSPFGLD